MEPVPVSIRLVYGKFDVMRGDDLIGYVHVRTTDSDGASRHLYRCYNLSGKWLGDRRTEAGALGLVNSQDVN